MMFAKYLCIYQSCQGLSCKKYRNHISCNWLITLLKSKWWLHPRAGIKHLVSPHTGWLRQLTLNVFIQRTANPSLVAAYIKNQRALLKRKSFYLAPSVIGHDQKHMINIAVGFCFMCVLRTMLVGLIVPWLLIF